MKHEMTAEQAMELITAELEDLVPPEVLDRVSDEDLMHIGNATLIALVKTGLVTTNVTFRPAD